MREARDEHFSNLRCAEKVRNRRMWCPSILDELRLAFFLSTPRPSRFLAVLPVYRNTYFNIVSVMCLSRLPSFRYSAFSDILIGIVTFRRTPPRSLDVLFLFRAFTKEGCGGRKVLWHFGNPVAQLKSRNEFFCVSIGFF